MSRIDVSLPVEMEKLEIEPVRTHKHTSEDNPFDINIPKQKKCFSKWLPSQNSSCLCCVNGNNVKPDGVIKKKHRRILKEPVLKLLKHTSKYDSLCVKNKSKTSSFNSAVSRRTYPPNEISVSVNLFTLEQNCKPLAISKKQNVTSNSTKNHKTEIKGTDAMRQSQEPIVDKNRAGPSCSQQALNPPCDVTIDELASYFETLVHIPKKMSSMAEMMYI